MKLIWAEKHLTLWLKIIGCTEDETVGILLMADTEETQYALMDFMAENSDKVTPQDVLTKLAEILRKTNVAKQHLKDSRGVERIRGVASRYVPNNPLDEC